jgi:hypothetical protein
MGTHHRLPGMSIPADTWQGLTELAEAVGATRTDLIRDAIHQLVRSGGENPELKDRLRALEHELSMVRRRLDAARTALLADTTVAA